MRNKLTVLTYCMVYSLVGVTVRRKAIPSLFPNEKSRTKHQAKRIESVYCLLNKTLMKEGRCLIIHQTKAPTKLNLDSGNCF